MTTENRTAPGCALDTDGDGNCHVHPQGCPGPSVRQTARERAEMLVHAWSVDPIRTGPTALIDRIEQEISNAASNEREGICRLILTLGTTPRARATLAATAAAIRARKDGAR